MTAEVAIMNQHALVLAADSASTVSVWPHDEPQTRYLKGANKLFQLSDHHPVGLMIYGCASLHGVPWELLIKDFRANLGARSCERLSAYSRRLFEFIKSHTVLFSNVTRKELFRKNVANAALSVVQSTTAQGHTDDSDPVSRVVAFEAGLDAHLMMLKATPPEAPVRAIEVEAAVATHTEATARMLAKEPTRFGLPSKALARMLAETAIRELMVHYKNYLPSTGVVIGGYGDNDYYPGIEEFECCGFLDRQFICTAKVPPTSVSGGSPVGIIPFATTSMIRTFWSGIGPDIYADVIAATDAELRELARNILESLAPDRPIANIEVLIREAAERHWRRWFSTALRDHCKPLLRLIEVLPVSQIATLAKSMIELQSLKERVTQATESVARPVDVAVISKHQGFVWAERKHDVAADLHPLVYFNE